MTETTKTVSIADEMKSLSYTPADMAAWNKLDESAQRSVLVRKRNEREMNAARKLVKGFVQTDEFGKLPKDLQAAITRICGKTGGGSGGGRKNPFGDKLAGLFPKVKTAVTELDIFMATKMGRGEFRKRVREALKGATVEGRLWIEFNDETESWVLLAIGGDKPAKFAGKDI